MQEELRMFQSRREDDKIDIIVRRKKVLRSAAYAINNQIGFSFYAVPVITFSGKNAVDLGGPKRVFFFYVSDPFHDYFYFSSSWVKL